MSDFLSNLLARSSADSPAIQPRLASRYESSAGGLITDVQSFAPAETAAQTPSSEIPTAPKLFAKDQPAIGKSFANEDSVAEIRALPTNKATAISTPGSNSKIENYFGAKKTVAPITAPLNGKNSPANAKPQSIQPASARPA